MTNPTTPPDCADCKHRYGGKCLIAPRDYGEDYYSIRTERDRVLGLVDGHCGPTGRNFEPRVEARDDGIAERVERSLRHLIQAVSASAAACGNSSRDAKMAWKGHARDGLSSALRALDESTPPTTDEPAKDAESAPADVELPHEHPECHDYSTPCRSEQGCDGFGCADVELPPPDENNGRSGRYRVDMYYRSSVQQIARDARARGRAEGGKEMVGVAVDAGNAEFKRAEERGRVRGILWAEFRHSYMTHVNFAKALAAEIARLESSGEGES